MNPSMEEALLRAYHSGELRITLEAPDTVLVEAPGGGRMELKGDAYQDFHSGAPLRGVVPFVLEEMIRDGQNYRPFFDLVEQHEAFPVQVSYSVQLRRKDITALVELGLLASEDWLTLERVECPSREAAYSTPAKALTYGGKMILRGTDGRGYELILEDFQAGFCQWLTGGGDWNHAVQGDKVQPELISDSGAELLLRLALRASDDRRERLEWA